MNDDNIDKPIEMPARGRPKKKDSLSDHLYNNSFMHKRMYPSMIDADEHSEAMYQSSIFYNKCDKAAYEQFNMLENIFARPTSSEPPQQTSCALDEPFLGTDNNRNMFQETRGTLRPNDNRRLDFDNDDIVGMNVSKNVINNDISPSNFDNTGIRNNMKMNTSTMGIDNIVGTDNLKSNTGNNNTNNSQFTKTHQINSPLSVNNNFFNIEEGNNIFTQTRNMLQNVDTTNLFHNEDNTHSMLFGTNHKTTYDKPHHTNGNIYTNSMNSKQTNSPLYNNMANSMQYHDDALRHQSTPYSFAPQYNMNSYNVPEQNVSTHDYMPFRLNEYGDLNHRSPYYAKPQASTSASLYDNTYSNNFYKAPNYTQMTPEITGPFFENPWFFKKKRKNNPILWHYVKNAGDDYQAMVHPSKYSSVDYIQGTDHLKGRKLPMEREYNNTILPLFINSNKELNDEYRCVVYNFKRKVHEIDFTNVTVHQLKILMREFGLNHTGKKHELIERAKNTLLKIEQACNRKKVETTSQNETEGIDDEYETCFF